MSETYIPADLRRLVVTRAQGHCEYCRIGEGDLGQIAAGGDVDGQVTAVLLTPTPTPEPGSAALALLGGLGLLARRRRITHIQIAH